jgi:hypothetical protein
LLLHLLEIKKMKLLKMVSILTITLAASPVFAADSELKTQTLCGWFVNSAPQEATLLDRSGEWVIGQQGGHQAEGDWLEFRTAQWADTNGGSYGYGCACIKGVVNTATKEVVSITSTKAQSLSVCKKDRTLPKPD